MALFQALPRLGAPLTSLLLQSFTPPLGALVEWLWLGTTLSHRQIGSMVVIMIGVGLALAPEEHLRLGRRQLFIGICGCLLAALGTAIGAVLSRKAYALIVVAGEPVSGPNAAFQRIAGGLLVAALCLLVVKRQVLRVQMSAPKDLILETARRKWRGVWLYVLINGIAGQTLGVSCMQWALETTPTGIVLAIITLTPIVLIPMAAIFDGQKPTRRSLAGAAVAVTGAISLSLLK